MNATSLPKKDSRLQRTFKAVRGLAEESNVRKIQRTLREYKCTFTFYLTDFRDSPGKLEELMKSILSKRYFEVLPLAVRGFIGREKVIESISQSFSHGSDDSHCLCREVCLPNKINNLKTYLRKAYVRCNTYKADLKDLEKFRSGYDRRFPFGTFNPLER